VQRAIAPRGPDPINPPGRDDYAVFVCANGPIAAQRPALGGASSSFRRGPALL
jgi:hypothetical protein